jgi:hypothetical protein
VEHTAETGRYALVREFIGERKVQPDLAAYHKAQGRMYPDKKKEYKTYLILTPDNGRDTGVFELVDSPSVLDKTSPLHGAYRILKNVDKPTEQRVRAILEASKG